MRCIARRTVLGLSAALATALTGVSPATAADVTLRFHQLLPPQAAVPKNAIMPWIEQVQAASNGRIKIQHFPAMQLGGKPPELFDQAKNGVVDIVWTVLGYTPGRFPKAEVFELPFMTGDPVKGSVAFQSFVEQYAADEFKDIKLIAVHVHGPGLFHGKEPVTQLADLKGLKVRGGSRVVNIMLTQLGATPVGMPVPAVGQALSKGVIDSTTIPYEIVPALKLHQIVKNHTEFSGDKGLYTQTFVVAMNKGAYDKLPADLKKVIDDHSGAKTAALFGKAMADGDKVGRGLIEKAGNKIVTLSAAETAPFKRQGQATRDAWVQEASKAGIDGAALIRAAESIIAQAESR